jgi:hypothetical protein
MTAAATQFRVLIFFFWKEEQEDNNGDDIEEEVEGISDRFLDVGGIVIFVRKR